ncbi:unnamed protein product [Lasius platythorax]|uniref:Uncharacterized protein n=1 Tax=Lasius platythorax TaxID=488582 RepID=A0AAV2N367_9HYME
MASQVRRLTRRKDKKDRRRRSGKEPRREMGFNLEITRPNDKKTEKKFRFGEWETGSVRRGKYLVAETM